jgi:hypothetical protein
MIDVRVAEDDGIDPGRIERRLGPIPQSQRFQALKQPAIQKHLSAAVSD